MARVEGLKQEKPGLLARFVFRAAKRRLGKVSESLQISANLQKVLFGRGIFEVLLDRSCLVDRRIRRLAEIKAGMIIGCPA